MFISIDKHDIEFIHYRTMYMHIFVIALRKGILDVAILFTKIFFCLHVLYKCCNRYLLRIQQWSSVKFHFCCSCNFFCFFSMASFEARNDENHTKDENGNSNPDYCYNHVILMFELSILEFFLLKVFATKSVSYQLNHFL